MPREKKEKHYFDLTQGMDGEVLSTFGPFKDEDHLWEEAKKILEGEYIKKIYYVRSMPSKEGGFTIDFGSHTHFLRTYVIEE